MGASIGKRVESDVLGVGLGGRGVDVWIGEVIGLGGGRGGFFGVGWRKGFLGWEYEVWLILAWIRIGVCRFCVCLYGGTGIWEVVVGVEEFGFGEIGNA